VHAGGGRRSATTTGYKVAQKCIRCGRSSFKLVGCVLCVSCYNRQREATIWRNARNKAPVKAGSRLRWIHALIRVQPEVMHGSPYMGRTYRRPQHPGIPCPMQYGKDGTFWVEALMTGADEFNAYLRRILPNTEIIDMDIGPHLVELHSATLGPSWRLAGGEMDSRFPGPRR
jgi:hypothetical protein